MNHRHVGHNPVRAVSGEQRHALPLAELRFEPGGDAINFCDCLTPGVFIGATLMEVSHPDFVGLCACPMARLFSESAAFHDVVTYWRSRCRGCLMVVKGFAPEFRA